MKKAGVDIETSDVLQDTILIAATGNTIVIEQEYSPPPVYPVANLSSSPIFSQHYLTGDLDSSSNV